jgi:phage terminase large subunit
MSFVVTTAIKKIRKLKARKKVIQGGTSASKTFGVLTVLIDMAAKKPRLEVSVVSESIPHLRRGAMRDFKKIMQMLNRWRDEGWNETLLTYKFVNGSYIEFFSADQEAKLRGARRQVLYINEANNITFDAYHQLAIRTSQDIFIDFNPTQEFWAHTELKNDDDTDFIVLTYKDNEALSETIVKEIEMAKEKAHTSTYWANWWKVYGEGQVGSLEGVIFDNWQMIDHIPDVARLVALGLDFGYTNDPSALVAYYTWDDKIVFDEIIYAKGLSNEAIAKEIQRYDFRDAVIYADSAEPKSIDQIRSYGIQIVGTGKGRDSVSFGISLLQQKMFYVTKTSLNMIHELRSYTWDKDKTGRRLNTPIGTHNHSIDALRYIAMNKLSNSPSGKYHLI